MEGLGSGAGPLLRQDLGPPLPAGARYARPGGAAAPWGTPDRAGREGDLRLHRTQLLPPAPGGSTGGVQVVRESSRAARSDGDGGEDGEGGGKRAEQSLPGVSSSTVLPSFSALSVFSAFSACSDDDRTPIVLYSPHGRDQLTLLEKDFEQQRPDIDVRWLDMGSQEILDRLRFERVNPQADVWFGGPVTIFDRGIRDSLLAPYRPVWAQHVSPRGIGPDDLYFPTYRTPAVIAFNSRAVSTGGGAA